MAGQWKPPTKEVAAAQTMARSLGATHVVTFYRLPDNRYGMVTYGNSGKHCKEAGKVGDRLFADAGEAFDEATD